jgi:hypothetical protein
LSENLGRTDDAIQVLDTALGHSPDWFPALAGRAVLHARRGHRESAIRDARDALALDDHPVTIYQAACVFAQTQKQNPADRPEAIRLLAASFRKDISWTAVAAIDPDLAPIRDRLEFQELLKAYTVVQKAESAR